ncbi:MAG: hypothetical protein LBU77_06330 [Clostridiales bacterium]|jgi:septum formation inhibitor-activating ATPase MinD|nr:hypothetical protein [Clostridiales bacterium]
MAVSRITIFAGHYGSGKTNLALNYAFLLKKAEKNVVICDLDIVNPYFRALDSKDDLDRAGIQLITSDFSNSNAELPSMPANTQAIFDNPAVYAVVDLGGDDRGALALGRYRAAIQREPAYDMLLVANKYRPLSGNVPDLIEIKEEIEAAAGVRFTGIVNNSNLAEETTAEDVFKTETFIQALSAATGLPVKFTAINETLLDSGDARFKSGCFPVQIYKKSIWKI